jgi:hypothetical protein
MTQSSVIRDNDGARYLSILLKTSEIVLEKMEISKNWFFENNEIIVWSIFVVGQNNIFCFPSMGGENLFSFQPNVTGKSLKGRLDEVNWGAAAYGAGTHAIQKCMLQMCMSKKPPHLLAAADNWNCNFLCFVFLYFSFLRRWLTLIEIFFIYSLPRKAE